MGTKAGMTTVFTEDGLALPCTVIALEEGNVVSQVRFACRRICAKGRRGLGGALRAGSGRLGVPGPGEGPA